MFFLPSLHSYIKPHLDYINSDISQIISEDFIKNIAQNVAFGGKRIRPIILILLSKILGGKHEQTFLNSAVAIELIHLASLLHDDVIDQGKIRHGKEASHILFGNQQVILGGDFLFAESFKKIVQTQNIEVIEVLSQASSVLASGELKQIQTKIDNTISDEKYFDIIYKKTAALFEASTGIASIIQNKKSDEAFAFGKNIGMAFQIIDDLLDYKSHNTGKKLGTDYFESKITLPIIFASKNNNYKIELKNLFEKTTKTKEDLAKVTSILEQSNAIKECEKIAISYCNKAKTFLKSFENSKETSLMLDVMEFFLKRVI